jgi:uncharacterized RDD family membrane protein YckC
MGTVTVQQLDVGHWVLRFIALLIDSIIISIVTWILLIILPGSVFLIGVLEFPFIVGIIQVFYFALLDVSWGGTIGKRFLGLKVQMTDGDKVTLDKSFIRNISKIYWVLLLLDWIIALFTPGRDKRQKYSDRFAGTTVVQTSQAMVTIIPPTNTNQ